MKILALINKFNPNPYKVEGVEKFVRALSSAAVKAEIELEYFFYSSAKLYACEITDVDRFERVNPNAYYEIFAKLLEQTSNCDVLLIIDVNPLHPTLLEKIKVPIVYYSADDPEGTMHRWYPYSRYISTLIYVTPIFRQNYAMNDFVRNSGICNGIYSHIGVTDDLVSTDVPWASRESKFVFVGSMTERRYKLLSKLKDKFGSNIDIYTPKNYKSHIKLCLVAKRYVPVRHSTEISKIYQRYKFAINIHEDGVLGFGNRRLFEVPALGCLLLSDYGNSHLLDVYDVGSEVLGYESDDELIKVMSDVLATSNNLACHKIAQRGQSAVIEKYQFEKIWKENFEKLKAIYVD